MSEWFTNHMIEKEFREMFYKKDFIESFLNKIDREMISQNISRSELARRLDFSTKKINRMFSGKTPLSDKEMTEMANAIDCDMELVETLKHGIILEIIKRCK